MDAKSATKNGEELDQCNRERGTEDKACGIGFDAGKGNNTISETEE